MIKINNDFTQTLEYEIKIDNLLNILQQKSNYLTDTYREIVGDNKTIDVITTDSFAFQNNIFDIKIENNRLIYNKISRHIYSDYYRFTKYIVQYANNYIEHNEKQEIDDSLFNILKKVASIHPYKINISDDRYTIKQTQIISDIVIDILESLQKIYKKQDEIIKTREKQLKIGINIDTYIEIMRHNNESLRSNIVLFNHFLERYNAYHKKYLVSVFKDINSLYNNIIEEIDFNGVTYDKQHQQQHDTVTKFTEKIKDKKQSSNLNKGTTSKSSSVNRCRLSAIKAVSILFRVNVASLFFLFLYTRCVGF